MYNYSYGSTGMDQTKKPSMLQQLREMNALESWIVENISPTYKDPDLTPILPSEAAKMYDEFLEKNKMTGEEHFYKLKEEYEAIEAKNKTTPPSP